MLAVRKDLRNAILGAGEGRGGGTPTKINATEPQRVVAAGYLYPTLYSHYRQDTDWIIRR